MSHYIYGEDRQATQITSLDSMIHPNNPVRLIDIIINKIVSDNPQHFLIKGQSKFGRKAFAPLTLLKLFVYGYLNRIPSSRRLERECCINIELQWLLNSLKPDFKTIADFRKNNGEAIRIVKVQFRKMLCDANLIGKELIAIDGTKIKANALNAMYSPEDLGRYIRNSEMEMQRYLDQMIANDSLDDAEEILAGKTGVAAGDIGKRIKELEGDIIKLKTLLDYSQQHGDISVNPTDPDSRRMRNHGKKEAAFNVQIAVDAAHNLIASDEVLQDCNDINAMRPVLDNLKNELDVIPDKVVMDNGYNNVKALIEVEQNTDKNIDLYVVVDTASPNQKAERQLSKWDFTYDSDTDTYVCPADQRLKRRGNAKRKNNRMEIQYYSPLSVCKECEYYTRCVKGKNGRIVKRFTDEAWNEEFRNRMRSDSAQALLKKRKSIIEHVFGTLKRWMGYQPLLLRGLTKVRTEISLYTIAYNLRRLVTLGFTSQWVKQTFFATYC